MTLPKPSVRYLVLTWIPEELLDEWNDWHNRVHIPHVLAAPQMRSVRKCRVLRSEAVGDWVPQFATIYTLDSAEAFHEYVGGPGPALRAEYDARYGGVGKIARFLLVDDDHAPARGEP